MPTPALLRRLPALAFLILSLLTSARAATLNVPTTAYPTIQAGINAAHDGDTVLVADGTYTGDGNRDLGLGKNITVKSQHGASRTIIDCQGTSANPHRGFFIVGNETNAFPNVVVDGFTVKNGYTPEEFGTAGGSVGGGICISSASATIQNCRVSGNTATAAGGGIFIYGSNTTLTNCTVSGNTAEYGGYGGGVFNESSNINVTNCTVAGNTAQNGAGNTAQNGGGIVSGSSTISLTNNIIYGDSGGEVCDDPDYPSTTTITVTNSDIQGGYTGTGNIDADPLFVNAAGGDLHLKAGSPCIGKGTHTGAPATDLDGKTRPNPPSMGAYEAGSGAPPILPATSTAVLLVHGTWSDASVWDAAMLPRLKGAGFTVEAVNFPTEPETLSNETYIELQGKALGRRIGELITRSGQPSVNLVCHSMGGLAAHYYLTHPNLWQNGGTYAGVSKVIYLGTPLLGLDSSILDPVATMAQARSATRPFSSDNRDTVAVDTYDQWSPAVREMFSEWEPAPDDTDSLLDPYPANLSLTRWPQDSKGNYQSPIQGLSYNFASWDIDTLPLGGPDYNAVSGMLNTIPDGTTKTKNHIAYYSQTAHKLGALYPNATNIWGVQSRRISQFLIDLNSHTDTSGAKVYMVAGTFPLAAYPYSIAIRGPYSDGLPNDGIVPTDSALGIDPLTKGFSLYPTADRLLVGTYHTDLPKNTGVVTQVSQWLQEIDSNGWTARAVSAGTSGQSGVLWSNTNATSFVQTVSANGATSKSIVVGPYPGATARALATAADGSLRLLWTNIDGTAAVWTINAQGHIISYGTVLGPYPGAQETGLAVGSDGKTRLLWTNTNGTAQVWTLDAQGGVVGYGPTYGPYGGGAHVSAIGCGADSKTRLLWTNTAGAASVWTLDAQANVLSYGSTYGPYDGATARAVSAGADGKTRLLWTNTAGGASVWTLAANGGVYTYGITYGPYTGAAVQGMSTGADNVTHLLWTNDSGQASVWHIAPNGGLTYSPTLGPF